MVRPIAKALVLIAFALLAGAAFAQSEDEKGRFVRFLEGMVSAPGRQVSLSGLEGAFSSNPTVSKITVADAEGVWLEIHNAEVVWTRRALFRRVVDIETLTAERVTVLRRPARSDGGGAEDDGSGLPVEISIDAFRVPAINVAAGIAGGEARLSADGSAEITAAATAARLEVLRQDRPGSLRADLRLEPAKNVLTADVQFAEPEGGLLAEALKLRGRPSISLAVAGTGPLTDWQGKLDLQAGGTPILAGRAGVLREERGYRISGDLAGTLQLVAPEAYATLLSGESKLAFDVVRGDDGALDLQSGSLRSAGVALNGSGALSADLVPVRANLTVQLGQAGRTAVPFAPGGLSVWSLAGVVGLDAGATAPWRAEIKASGLESAYGTADEVSLLAEGQASDLALPAARAATFRVEGSADGLMPRDRELADAIGPSIRFNAAGDWASGRPVNFQRLDTVLTGATASFAGTADGAELNGRFAASLVDLARVGPLLDRPLAGRAEFSADGRVAAGTGLFELQLAGKGADLRLGIAALDPLLAGETAIEGGLSRSAAGLRFDALKLANRQVAAEVSGALASPELDLQVEASLVDLASLSPRASGRADLRARITGTDAAPNVEADVRGADVVLMGRPFSDASARFTGIVAGPKTGGRAELQAKLGDLPVEGSATLVAGADGARRVEALSFSVGGSRASGDLTLLPGGLMAGDLAVVSPDLSKVAPLFLAEAGGMLRADIVLAAEAGGQSARINGTATDLVYEGITLDTADIEAAATDLLSAPKIEGEFAVRNLRAGGLVVVSAEGSAERQGEVTGFSLDADLADGSARLAGSLRPQGSGMAVALEQFAWSRAGLEASLAAPTTIAVRDGSAEFRSARFDVGGGSITLAGRAGAALDLTAELAGIPAALANSFAPDVGAEGTVSGRAVVTGTPAAPTGSFEASWRGASVAASRSAGLGALAITADGRLAGSTVSLESRISGDEGLALQVAGTVGTARGAPLDLQITGAAPLALGNTQLASRGAALSGELDIDLRVTGAAAAPVFAGRVTSEGGGYVDPSAGIALRDIALTASVGSNRVVFDRLSARSGDGTLAARGSVGLDPAAGFPADLTAEIRQARYVDGSLVSTRFDADLTLTGPLARAPVLGGSVFLDRTEVTVPEALPADSVAVGVEHVNTPADVQRTLAAMSAGKAQSSRTDQTAGPGGVALNVTIEAPQQIFVRGRGLDAELGGRLRLSGPASAPVADGAFEMNRGRLDVFTQRITFDRGVVTFAGDLDPVLDFAGTTQSRDVAITVAIAGQASDPEVTFSSVPELPQDEVLAHLIFNRGLAELSPVQIARLADAAAGLAGGGSGLLNQLRASTGLDDLDIVTDEEGGPALAAGRYVNENVYIGVQQGASAESSRVTIDLDITDDVKARAGVSPQGDSSLGVFFEREY